MDSLPAEFFEELLTINTAISYRASLLSGTVSICAQNYIQKAHSKTFFYNGTCVRSGSFRIDGKPTQSQDLRAKYRVITALHFTTRGSEVPPIDENFFKTFKSEPGMHYLILKSSAIDDKWIQEFVSWQRLNMFTLMVRCENKVEKLLEELLDRKRLLRLYFDFCEDTEIELGCEFLLQEQSQRLFYGSYRQESLKQLTTLRKKNEKKLSGKTVIFKENVPLHNNSFKVCERTEKESLRFESKKGVVEYWNENGTLEMSNEEFMKGVNYSIARFL